MIVQNTNSSRFLLSFSITGVSRFESIDPKMVYPLVGSFFFLIPILDHITDTAIAL